jgi:hypothetical protein
MREAGFALSDRKRLDDIVQVADQTPPQRDRLRVATGVDEFCSVMWLRRNASLRRPSG